MRLDGTEKHLLLRKTDSTSYRMPMYYDQNSIFHYCFHSWDGWQARLYDRIQKNDEIVGTFGALYGDYQCTLFAGSKLLCLDGTHGMMKYLLAPRSGAI